MSADPAPLPSALPPGSTVGILGGGQLGRMLSQAASRLGFDVVVLDPEENSPAGRVSRGQIVAAYDDPTALNVFGRVCDVVTFEFENVPARSVELLAEAGARVAPAPAPWPSPRTAFWKRPSSTKPVPRPSNSPWSTIWPRWRRP